MNETADVSQYSLTTSQSQIWAGQQLSVDSPLYNMVVTGTISAPIDPGRFCQAWNRVVDDYHSLRCCVQLADAQPKIIDTQTSSPTNTRLGIVDFSAHADPLSEANNWITQRCQTVFDLSIALSEAMLLKVSDTCWIWYLNQHHLITDAWSFQIIWKRLNQYYFMDEAPTAADQKELSYADYVSIERASKDTTKKGERALKYWKNKQISSKLVLYSTPVDHHSTASTRVNAPLTDHRLQALHTLSMLPEARSFSKNLSQYTVILSMLYVYLHRVSGETMLTVGSPALNRSDSRLLAIPGLFIEVLPLQIKLAAEETFTSLLTKVRSEVMQFHKSAVPGACSATSQRNVSVILNYISAALGDFGPFPTTIEWHHCGHIDAHHALRLQVTDWSGEGGISLDFDFNDACFTPALRVRALEQWWALFDAVAADPGRAISSLQILSKEEKALLGKNLHPTYDCTSYGYATTVVDVIDRLVEMHPNHIAVSRLENQMSYRQLHAKSLEIAHGLRVRGVGAGTRVGVNLRHSLDLPAVLVGILRSGAAYVPIDVTLPAARVAQLINEADVALVIVEDSADESMNIEVLGVTLAQLVSEPSRCNSNSIDSQLTTHESRTRDNENDDLSNLIKASDTAYILYTSGSSGKPKGVVISHSAMLNYCGWAADFYAQDKPVCFPLFTPIGFDLTVTSLFVPLMTGGQIRVHADSAGSVDRLLMDVMNDSVVDIVKLTPAHLSLMQQSDMSSSTITQLIVGGESLNTKLARRIHLAFGGNIQIHNEYGPTEATVGCVVHTYDSEQDQAASVPIGKPVAGMHAYVFNESRVHQPIGVTGELFLAGRSLADGYWQAPDLSAEKFCTDELENGPRAYRTGDLVRIAEDGILHYVGRIDNQVKIRGMRIEPAEIEACFRSLPGVTQCVVTVGRAGSQLESILENHCITCGISSNVPDISINTDGVCNLCIGFKKYHLRAEQYFKPSSELVSLSDTIKQANSGEYDCMMLLSGGKDSTYALARLQELGLSVLAFTLDNGYLSPEAMSNIKRVCSALGVDHHFAETPAMKQIFADSLMRYSNVCNGCFKAIYTLSMKYADELRIPYIFTGLSRGQFFETRLTEELFTYPHFDIQNVDDMVLSARKAYHRVDDAVSHLLDVSHFQSDDIFENVQFVDFYRYCDIDLDEMLDYLDTRVPWVRPTDTGRSTNCLINDVGIYVHKKERGYHNYALPYSWDVRLGHKNRNAALEELDDAIDEDYVTSVLKELNYQCSDEALVDQTRLALYFVAEKTISLDHARQQLALLLPPLMLPTHMQQLEKIPLTSNGKIDIIALPGLKKMRAGVSAELILPRNALESQLVSVWEQVLKVEQVGVSDNFFDLGGDSLLAIQIMAQINRVGFTYSASDMFENQTIAELSLLDRTASNDSTDSKTEPARAFSSVDPSQLKKLAALLTAKK